MSYLRRVLNTKFSNWLDEEIYISKGLEHAPRKYVLWQFIEDLRSFVKSEGYEFRGRENEMVLTWARYIFRMKNHLRKNITLKRNPDERPEDYDWYCHKFDYENTTSFINQWKDCDDFEGDGKLISDAFMLAWYFVDINASSETQKVDEMIGDSDAEEDFPRRRDAKSSDPYLEDQANAASKYNRWD
jgi:hypothetical protein